MEQWALVEFSFHQILGVDLEDVWRRKSWRWFETRVRGLLSIDSPLARFFAPDEQAPPQPEVNDGG
ncbi:hypothetical protein ABIQ69_11540 [Agromyces sp. G08B096]|uniref:Uncharacterized protein n=1 Tax=Agromyces sp. G08B096 TaxID=3156399 RepID=A0AAU7W481_9MICO